MKLPECGKLLEKDENGEKRRKSFSNSVERCIRQVACCLFLIIIFRSTICWKHYKQVVRVENNKLLNLTY